MGTNDRSRNILLVVYKKNQGGYLAMGALRFGK
jgi:hypothetical protein